MTSHVADDAQAPWTWPDDRLRDVGLKVLTNRPLIDIEAASACNAVCTFCPRESIVRPQRIMTPETFDHVNRLVPDGATVMFAGLGEPLMNRRLASFVRKFKERGISACIITNGMLLTPERQAELIDVGIDQIQVSVHGRDPSVVRQLMPTGVDPDRVEAHIEHLAAIRQSSLRVRLNVVQTRENAGEVPALRAWANRLGVGLFVRELHNRGGSLADPAEAPPDRPACGIYAAVTFMDAEGFVASCVNDVRSLSRLGHCSTLCWGDVTAWKARTIQSGPWFPACTGCGDDYRWTILANASVEGGEEVLQAAIAP